MADNMQTFQSIFPDRDALTECWLGMATLNRVAVSIAFAAENSGPD